MNAATKQKMRKEGRKEREERRGFGADSMTLLAAAGRPDGRGQADETTRRLPHLLPEEDDERPTRLGEGRKEGGRNCARAYTYSIVLRAEETSRRVEGHRCPSVV